MPDVADKLLTCRDCSGPFTFTFRQQERLASKGITRDPVRCATCRNGASGVAVIVSDEDEDNDRPVRHKTTARDARRPSRRPVAPEKPSFGGGGGGAPRPSFGGGAPRPAFGGAFAGGPRPPTQFFPAVCSRCNKQTQVPFQPRGDRPVYCSDCFRQQPQGPARR